MSNEDGAVVFTSPTGAVMTLRGPSTQTLCIGPNVEVRDGMCEPKLSVQTTAEQVAEQNRTIRDMQATLTHLQDSLSSIQSSFSSVQSTATANAAILANGPIPQRFGPSSSPTLASAAADPNAVLEPLGQILAQAACVGLKNSGGGYVRAVQRQCGSGTDTPDCGSVCSSLGKSCYNSIHIHHNEKFFTAQDQLGLNTYVYQSCGGGCGANVCCCA